MKEMEMRLIDINMIISNVKNRQISEPTVKGLAIDFLQNGILIPPIVHKNEKNFYVILSGHHRIAACRLLLEQGYEQFRYIKCYICDSTNENDRELILINSNLLSKPLTEYEKVEGIGRMYEIVKEKREKGELVFEGSTRKYVAQLSGLGETQVGTYLKVYFKAHDAVKEALKNELITLTEAARLSSYDKNEQLSRLIYRNKKNDYNYSKDKCIRNVEESMQSSLSTKVRISNHMIKISYLDIEDLNRILEILGQLESN